MLKNQLQTSLLNLWKDKGYTLLNVLGLTIGIIFSTFLLLYNLDELSYDRFNKSADNIYRISANAQEPKQFLHGASTPFPLRDVLSTGYPEVQEAVRLLPAPVMTFKIGNRLFNEEKVYFADPTIFKVFNFPLLAGNSRLALVQPNSIVISRTLALKYFGSLEQVIGKSLYTDSKTSYLISAVMEDVPHNSHIRFHALISRSSLAPDFNSYWGGFVNFTYVKLVPGTDRAHFETKLAGISAKFLDVIFLPAHVKIFLQLLPITAIHLHSLDTGEPEELGNMSYIYIFSIVAACMLIIASINYVNMSTARSSRRAREVGIRKVAGSTSSQLIVQFMLESALITLVSILLAIGGLILLLPVFNLLSGKELTIATLFQPAIVLLMGVIFIGCGLLAGSYPAIYLSRYKPVEVLKGNFSRGTQGIRLRRSLVVFQFSISMIMLISTWIVYDQLNFLQSKDLGFNKDQVLALHVKESDQLFRRIPSFMNELKKIQGVLVSGTASTSPGRPTNFNLLGVETGEGFDNRGINNYAVDNNYLNTLGIKVIQGRNFNGQPADTSGSVLVNEKLVKVFGWKSAIGMHIRMGSDVPRAKVIGVFRDFNQASLYTPIAPLVLNYYPVNSFILLKLKASGLNATLASISDSWKKFFPELLFDYEFIDKSYNSHYKADEQRSRIFTAFSALTVAISCLGLLGLVGFSTDQRKKEISIRKVLGARVAELVRLMIVEFMALICIAGIISFPVAWLIMHRWLAEFPYHTTISWISFLLAFLSLVVITFLTVSYHTLRSSMANPVANIRRD